MAALYKKRLTSANVAEIDVANSRFLALMVDWKEEDRIKAELAAPRPAGEAKPAKARR